MRKLSKHKISSIASLLADDENEAEMAGILGCYRALVAMYRMKASKNVAILVRGRLLKRRLKESEVWLFLFLIAGPEHQKNRRQLDRPLERESDFPM
ncbi:hypothetical protein K3495_g11934 [Podosphaera aphanis]|nr:hypothetical protein K3495_g11934 [Podosphaera aphanis]